MTEPKICEICYKPFINTWYHCPRCNNHGYGGTNGHGCTDCDNHFSHGYPDPLKLKTNSYQIGNSN